MAKRHLVPQQAVMHRQTAGTYDGHTGERRSDLLEFKQPRNAHAERGENAMQSKKGQLIIRFASLLVAFCLLLPATSAFGECAWVLWRHTAAGPEGLSQILTEDWDTLGAVESKEACQRMVVRLAPGGSIREYKMMPGGVRGEIQMILHCLPDSVDPRGPRAK